MQFSVTKQTNSIVVFMAFFRRLAIKQTQRICSVTFTATSTTTTAAPVHPLSPTAVLRAPHALADAPPALPRVAALPQTTPVRLSCEPMLWKVRNQSLEMFLNAINFQTQQLQTH